MLLKDFLKHTWKEHPDWAALNNATNHMSEIATYINNQKRGAENFQKLTEIQSLLTGKKTPVRS